MRKIVIMFALLASISACTKPAFNYTPKVQKIDFPDVGKVTQVTVGENMLVQATETSHKAFELTNDIGVNLDFYTLHKGFYTKTGQNEDGEFYLPESSPEGGRISKAMLVDPFQVIQLRDVNTTGGRLCIVTVFNNAACNSSFTPITFTNRSYVSKNNFQQSLIYLASVGNKVKIGYREFKNDMARPSFSNDIEYDLSKSNTIYYKNAQIEVIEADNRYIKYQVIRNFD